MSEPALRVPPTPATLDEWLAQPAELRLELIDGRLIPKAGPDLEHGIAQAHLSASLIPSFSGARPTSSGPGGWLFGSEVDIRLGANGFRPDISGWRRDRCPELRTLPRPLSVRPDWICEVLSPGNAVHDRVLKLRRYHQAGVPHYWVLDPVERELFVYRHTPDGYLLALAAFAGEVVRAEPFEAIELDVAGILGLDGEPSAPPVSPAP